MFLEFMLELGKYKDTFAVLAPFLALFGILWIDRGNSRRQHDQLNHDRGEKAKDRAVSRRQELYSEVMGHLATATFQLVNPKEAKEGGASGYKALIAQGVEMRTLLAKLALLAEPRTARLAALLNREFADLTQKTAAAMRPIWDKDSAMQTAWDTGEHHRKMGDELSDEFGEELKKGEVPPEKFARIQTGLAFWSEQRATVGKEWARLSMERQSLWEAFVESFRIGAEPVERLSRELRLSMRKDLELSEDADADKVAEADWKLAKISLEMEKMKPAQATRPIVPGPAGEKPPEPTFIPTAPFPTEKGGGEATGADERKKATG